MKSITTELATRQPITTVKTRRPDFVAAIAAPEVSELLSPYMLGVLDAERGEIAVPENYYTQRGQMCEYCEGYEAVAGATLTTRQFLGNADAAPDGYMLGRVDASRNVYAPPSWQDTVQYDAYVKGHNDEWAKRNNIAWWSRNQ